MSESLSAFPAHMQYKDAWDLAKQPDVERLNDFLTWIADDDGRFESAANSMQWLPPGFNMLLLARDVNSDGTVKRSIQLNFYHPKYPGNEQPHGHSKNARTIWYAPPGAQQVISRYAVLDSQAPRIQGLDIKEMQVAGNCIVDLQDGRRPIYEPVALGNRWLVEQSVTQVAPLGSQDFSSVEVHHIGFRGDGVSVSVHYKGPEESPDLSGIDGLVHYKHVTREEAEELVRVRNELALRIGEMGVGNVVPRPRPRMGPITMMYIPPGSVSEIETLPSSTPISIGEFLVRGAIHTTEKLKRAA
jgi:hypothetical protein